MRSIQSLTVALHPSTTLAAALLAAHGVAIAAVWLAGLPLGWHVAFKLAVGASLLVSMAGAGWLRAGRAACALTIAAPGGAEHDTIDVTLRDRRVRSGAITAGSFVSPWFAVIHFRATRRWWPARTLLVMSDSTDPESFRALRVRIRWGRTAAV